MSNEVLREMTKTIVDLRARIEALETAEVIPSQLQASDGVPNPCLSADASGNLTQADGLYIATDEIRARDGDGLKLYDDSGAAGIFVADGGNVGIGVTPQEVLHVYSGTDENIQIGDKNIQGAAGSVSIVAINDSQNANIPLEIHGSQFWFHGGDFGIGASPTSKFHVFADDASGYIGYFHNDGDNLNRYGLNVVCGDDDGDNCSTLSCLDGDGDWHGTLGIYTQNVEILQASERKLKEKIVDTDSVVAKVMAVPVRDFRFRRSPGNLQRGFIFEEVADVFPEAVVEADGEHPAGVLPMTFIPVLVKMCQEQQEIVGTLAARLDALENPRLEPK